jgi:hypothetical protein
MILKITNEIAWCASDPAAGDSHKDGVRITRDDLWVTRWCAEAMDQYGRPHRLCWIKDSRPFVAQRFCTPAESSIRGLIALYELRDFFIIFEARIDCGLDIARKNAFDEKSVIAF